GMLMKLSPLPSPSGHRCATPLPFAPRDLCRERVQLRLPKTPELADPGIHRLKSRNIHRIEPSLRLRPDPGEAALPQDLEVLRHRRLRNPELASYRRYHLPRGHFPPAKQFEDTAAHRIGQDVKDVH